MTTKIKYIIINELQKKHSKTIKILCKWAGISRAGYYNWVNKKIEDINKNEYIEKMILEIYNS